MEAMNRPTEKQIEAARIAGDEAWKKWTGGGSCLDGMEAIVRAALSAALAVESGTDDISVIQELIDGTDWLGTGTSQKAADANRQRCEAAWSRILSAIASEKARADAAEAEHRFSLGLLDNAQATIVSLTSQLETGKEKPRRMSWEEMDAAGMDYCPRCGDTEHVRRIGSPAVVIECETCTKAIADRSEPNGADRRPYSALTTSPHQE